MDDDIVVGNASRFFSCLIGYENAFPFSHALRSQLKLEVSFQLPALQTETKTLQSFIALATQAQPEVQAMICVSPIETAADKVSALTWRVLTRIRYADKDDPTVIRHLHDLSLLENYILQSPKFSVLAIHILNDDFTKRSLAAKLPVTSVMERLYLALNMLNSDEEYAREYEQFVVAMSYARTGETPSFIQAMESLQRIIRFIGDEAV
ncbi:MAG: hypothetical protein ACI8WB_005693 [Phenylobacterium sp.]